MRSVFGASVGLTLSVVEGAHFPILPGSTEKFMSKIFGQKSNTIKDQTETVSLSSGLSRSKSVKKETASTPEVSSDSESPITVPREFDQKLLVCNACPDCGDAGIVMNQKPVTQLFQAPTASSSEFKHHVDTSGLPRPLRFNECRYMDGKVSTMDQVTFKFDHEGMQGTFEVDELPNADSELLLLVQRAIASDKNQQENMIAFQSFAFAPQQSGSENAQVAFLNAVAGDKETHLKMADGIYSNNYKKREESVLFDRVYAIEEGNYNIGVDSKNPAHSLSLHGGKDYVIVKTGTKQNPQLLVFPDDLSSSVFVNTVSMFFGSRVAQTLQRSIDTTLENYRMNPLYYFIMVMVPLMVFGLLLAFASYKVQKSKADKKPLNLNFGTLDLDLDPETQPIAGEAVEY